MFREKVIATADRAGLEYLARLRSVPVCGETDDELREKILKSFPAPQNTADSGQETLAATLEFLLKELRKQRQILERISSNEAP